MVGINSAGSATNVRRMRRETVLTRFLGEAQDTPLQTRRSAFQIDAVLRVFYLLPRSWQRIRDSNPCTGLERAVS